MCCSCDCLICDFTVLILRCFSRCEKTKNDSIFLSRCCLGIDFDVTEFRILTLTEEGTRYVWFGMIFFFDFVFLVLVFTCCCLLRKLSNCVFTFVFKLLSLLAAITIFTTAYDFQFDNIETHFTNMDSTKGFFHELVVLVSFMDVCLNSAELVLNLINICYVCRKSKKDCCGTLGELTSNQENRVGMNIL